MLQRVLLAAVAVAALAGPARAVEIIRVIQVFNRAQTELIDSWRPDPHLVCRSATVFGQQQKRAASSDILNLITRNPSIDPALPEIAAGIPIFDGLQVRG